MTVNEQLFDAALRHQIALRRLESGEVAAMIRILEEADRELSDLLRRRLGRLAGGVADFTSQRWVSLIKSVRELRDESMRELRRRLRSDLIELSAVEARFETETLRSVLPVEIEFATVEVATLRSLVSSRPFGGGTMGARTLGQWADSLRLADRQRIIAALQLGIVSGETVDQMVRRIAGTRRAGYANGVLAISRRNAEAVVRTAVNHVSNAARAEVWAANADIIAALRWTATLDGRTSAICQARDGKFTPVGEGELPAGLPKLVPPGDRPPAHIRCRSVMVAVLDADGVAAGMPARPTVLDARTRQRREIDFRAQARAEAGHRWRRLTRNQRNLRVRRIREGWANRVIGRAPAETTYEQWLRRQPAAFQNEVLGVAKGRLFRAGGMSLDRFVDRAGNQLTLEQLAKLDPGAFVSAGIDMGSL